eukprot:311349-Hanusia_phi.AAC.1
MEPHIYYPIRCPPGPVESSLSTRPGSKSSATAALRHCRLSRRGLSSFRVRYGRGPTRPARTSPPVRAIAARPGSWHRHATVQHTVSLGPVGPSLMMGAQ